MKKQFFKPMIAAMALFAAIQVTACKGKKAETNADTTTGTTVVDTGANTTAPVNVAPDDELTKGVKDATKDFPRVKADVKSGEITLTGTITRDKLQTLMMSLNSLHPKKINNQLTIEK